MARPKADPEIRRGQLLDVAERLFTEKGYDETAVSDIVGDLGVAQGTFYYYFASKDDILDALVHRIMDSTINEARSVADEVETDAPAKLLGLYRLFIQMRVEHHVLDYLHMEENAKLHYRFQRERIPRYVPLFTRVVEQGVGEGVFRTEHPRMTAAGLLLLSTMVELTDTTPETFGIRPDIIAPLQDQMERILGAEPGTLDGYGDLWEGLHEPQ